MISGNEPATRRIGARLTSPKDTRNCLQRSPASEGASKTSVSAFAIWPSSMTSCGDWCQKSADSRRHGRRPSGGNSAYRMLTGERDPGWSVLELGCGCKFESQLPALYISPLNDALPAGRSAHHDGGRLRCIRSPPAGSESLSRVTFPQPRPAEAPAHGRSSSPRNRFRGR